MYSPILDFVWNPRRWAYVPPPWISPLSPWIQLELIFRKLFEL